MTSLLSKAAKTLLLAVLCSCTYGMVQAQGTGIVLNLELDYLQCADHTHALDSSSIEAMVAMFACHGITLNVVLDDAIPGSDCSYISSGENGWYWYAANYRDHAGEDYWFYGVLVHDICNFSASGYAQMDMFIAETSPDKPFESAARVLHEFGHNLGLAHGGNDTARFKPNYPSLMNYRYRNGVGLKFLCDGLSSGECPSLKMLDFSNGNLPSLTDDALDESAGLGFGPVDWNCNGQIDAGLISHNIYGGSRCVTSGPGASVVYSDFDDWNYIINRWSPPLLHPLYSSQTAIACFDSTELAAAQSSDPMYPVSNCYMAPPVAVTPEGCQPPFIADTDGDGLDDYCDPCPYQFENTCCCAVPGDADGSGARTYPEDRNFLIAYIFQGGNPPPCMDQADVNGDGIVSSADIIYLNNYFLYEGPEPVCGTSGQ